MTARCSCRSGRISSRVTSSQVISAAITHISSGSSSSSRSTVVICGTRGRRPGRSSAPLPSGQSLSRIRSHRRARWARPISAKLALAVAQDRAIRSSRSRLRARRCAVRPRGSVAGRHAADHADAKVSASLGRARSAAGCRPARRAAGRRCRRRSRPRTAAGRRPSRARTLGDRGRDGQRPLSAVAGAVLRRPASAPLAAIRSASALRAIRLSIARAAARAWSSAAAAQHVVGLADAGLADPDQGKPDRQQRGGEDQEQLGGGRQRREALGAALIMRQVRRTAAQLSLPSRSRKSSGTDSRSVSS